MFSIINKKGEILHQCPMFSTQAEAINYINAVKRKDPDTYVFGFVEVRDDANIALQANKYIESFFFYMWNAWDEYEAHIVFPENPDHFWKKYTDLHARYNGHGAVSAFFASLSHTNRHHLVSRAISLYDGPHRK